MGRLRTFTNWAGSPALAPPEARFGPADLNIFQDEYEVAFGRYRPICHAHMMTISTLASATTYVVVERGGVGLPNGAQVMAAEGAIYLDPADIAIPFVTTAPRTTKLRLTVDIATGATAPTGTWTFSLRPISGFTSTSGNFTMVNGVGAAVTNSDFTVASGLTANSRSRLTGIDFDHPVAGFYAICLTNTATFGAGGTCALVTLEYRHV